jgi:hypothetical protein
MSFKYTDDAFLQEFEKVINLLKQGQATPPQPIDQNSPYVAPKPNGNVDTNSPYTDPEEITNLAKKLVNRLQQGAGISKNPENNQSGDLYVRDLQDLNSLIIFLRTEGIQSDGQPIVAPRAAKVDPKVYAEYTLATGYGATPVDEKIFVNKNGLISYLRSLQKQAADEPNELLAAMVGRLIDDANKKLQLNMAADKTKQEETAKFDDKTPLDHISDTLLLDNPIASNGNIPVIPANLSSPAAFSDFIKKLKLKSGDTITISEDFTDRSYCDIITFLWKRARSKYYGNRTNVDKYYVDLVSKLSEQYSCNIQGASSGDKAQPSGYQNVAWRPGQPLTPEMQQAMAPIGMRYPLINDRIDFRWINEWVVNYQSIMKKVGGNVEESAQNVIDISNSIMATYGFTSQNLNDTAVGIYRTIRGIAINKLHKTPQEAIYVPMYYVQQQLFQLLSLLVKVLQAFKRDFYDSMPDEWKAQFDRQIDDTAGSLASVNIRKVEEWISMMNDAKVRVEKEM